MLYKFTRNVVMGLVGILFLSEVILIAAEPKSELKKRVKYADGLYATQQYNPAKEAYAEIIYIFPENEYKDYAQFMIAECYQRGNSLWHALVEWEKLVKGYPDSKWTEKAKKQIETAHTILQNSEPPTWTLEDKKAAKYILFAKDFKDRSVRKGEYGIVYNQEELDQALYWYNKVITEFKDSWLASKAQYEIGQTYMIRERKSDYRTAVEEFQKVIDNHPGNVFVNRSLRKIGDIYRDNLLNKKAAIAAYQKVIELNKDDPGSFYVSYAKAQINYLK